MRHASRLDWFKGHEAARKRVEQVSDPEEVGRQVQEERGARAVRVTAGVQVKRASAAGGLLYVASLVVVLVATRTSPEPKEPAQKIAADLLAHRSDYAFAAYVAALQAPLLLLFAAGFGTSLAMGAAATAAALDLIGEGALAAAAYRGGLDAFALHTPLLLLGGLPLALLVLVAPPPRRWLFRVATWGIAALFVIGSAGVLSASQSSGLEGAWFFGLLLFTVWVAVTSVRWLRGQPANAPDTRRRSAKK